ncbi:MAG: diacylglycerol kinase (ATP) [Psychrosphaera sp.]|jgi:diacylglycerol kinase (ATP)|uniref:Diacylglycerol kinase n=1 Tax=Psychrosphaera aquimarina TaxID=2044854 RepID=A0ABU3R085_9GAMM|nr:diacylglycerol kinase [Psychrosphaera aquimarina]MDU0113087.1 diacylglycerol kinase [Psychrosphaera aquimarina]
MFDNENKPKGIKRIYLASLNSTRAFKWLLKNESAFRQELLLFVLCIPLTFYFDVSPFERTMLILSIVFIMFTEVINTAIEAVVDRISLDIHPLSGLAKDLGSAAVLISIVIASCIWTVILFS